MGCKRRRRRTRLLTGKAGFEFPATHHMRRFSIYAANECGIDSNMGGDPGIRESLQDTRGEFNSHTVHHLAGDELGCDVGATNSSAEVWL